MYDKEDFDNPMDWVIYKVNGKKRNNIIYDEDLFEKAHMLKNAKYPLKFYKNSRNKRYNVYYKSNYICNCELKEVKEVQYSFDELYDDDIENIMLISENLKKKYNILSPSYSLDTTRVRFSIANGSRLSAYCNMGGDRHHLCCCYPKQKKECYEHV